MEAVHLAEGPSHFSESDPDDPHRCAQRLVSQVLLDPVQLSKSTIKNHIDREVIRCFCGPRLGLWPTQVNTGRLCDPHVKPVLGFQFVCSYHLYMVTYVQKKWTRLQDMVGSLISKTFTKNFSL